MNLTQQEVTDSLKVAHNDLFPSYRALFFIGLSVLSAMLASYSVIRETTAILLILVYLGVTLHRVLEGIFKQLEWLRYESAHQRITVESRIEHLAEIILEQKA